METRESFQPTPQERQGELWRRLMLHFAARIAALHVQLEDATKTPEATAVLRGEIRALRSLMRLDKEPPSSG